MNDKEQSNMEKEQEILNEETTLVQDPVEAVEEVAEVKTEVITKNSENELVNVKINKRILQGKVVSNKADKTIIIKVERQVAHPIYKKYYKKTNKFMAHDENNDCNQGDTVRVRECRPLSKRKSWELVEIVNRAK